MLKRIPSRNNLSKLLQLLSLIHHLIAQILASAPALPVP